MKKMVALFLVWILVGCQTSSPEGFVQERVLVQNMDPTSYHVRSVQTDDRGTLVIYSVNDALNPNYQHLGFAVVQRGLTGWKLGMEGSTGRDLATLTGQALDFIVVDISYETSMGRHPNFTHQLVYGELLSSEVVAISAVFQDATTIAQDVASGEAFAFVTPKANPICALRLLDAQQQVVDTITPSDHWKWRDGECEEMN